MTGTSGSALKAGAGNAPIEFAGAAWPIDGFGSQSDPLCVRTLLIEVEGEEAAIVVLDQTSLAPEPLAAVREVIATELGLRTDRLLVGVSHTFSAPHLAPVEGMDASTAERMTLAWEAVLAAVATSARQARAALRQASIMTGEGRCSININRDVETRDGWGLGRDENGYSDKALPVVRFVGSDGDDIAVLANYAVQPSTMSGSRDSAGLLVASADLAGDAVRRVEESLPGVVALFLIGAAGDQSPVVDARDNLGAQLGAEIVRAAEHASGASAAPVRMLSRSLALSGQDAVDRADFAPTRSHQFRPTGTRDLPFWIMTIGEVAIVGVQVELSAEFGARLRAASPFATTLVVTMVNGGDKYLPDASSFDRMTYEALTSRYARGGAELLENELVGELRELVSARK